MNRFTLPVLATALVVLTVPASLSAKLTRNPVPPARYTGPERLCVPVRQLGDSRIRDDRTIDFMRTGRKGWRVALPRRCSGLRAADSFTYRTSLSQLCNTDVIYPLNSIGGRYERAAGCGLGKFQPIELIR